MRAWRFSGWRPPPQHVAGAAIVDPAAKHENWSESSTFLPPVILATGLGKKYLP
jgi:hypothetical protein